MKKRVLAAIIALFLLFMAGYARADSSILIYVDGRQVQSDVPPQIVEGRTMVPLRAIAESLGAQIDWDGDTNTVSISTDPVTEPAPATEPTITGPDDFTALIREALNLTKQKDAAVYDYICTGITTIDFGPGKQGYTAFNHDTHVSYVDSGYAWVKQSLPNHNDKVAFYVASLVHEASHTHIYEDENFYIGDSGLELAVCDINALRALQICANSPKVEQFYKNFIREELSFK